MNEIVVQRERARMTVTQTQKAAGRYEFVGEGKSGGVTYTPRALADFVAEQMVKSAGSQIRKKTIKVLDPAVGQGELLLRLLERLPSLENVEVHGFETDLQAVQSAESRLRNSFPTASIKLKADNFLHTILEMSGGALEGGLFESPSLERYDLIIANPPYVRTQIMGTQQAQILAAQFGLNGRIDLYHAFILGMAKVLSPHGIAGIIVSNRFMTTKTGRGIRLALRERFNLRHVWDLGDTKLFDAAVLPAVLLAEGRNGKKQKRTAFTSIYETQDAVEHAVVSPINALDKEGVVQTPEKRRFRVRQGWLDESEGADGLWRIATQESDKWLGTVKAHTWRTFREIGKIRVGVKTCADAVFIRNDWDRMPAEERPELLRPLTTHHIARRFKATADEKQRQILYPHVCEKGVRRVVNLKKYPRSAAYLERHRAALSKRSYVLQAGRQWFEIWVPQDPEAWDKPKLAFRDISERPCFWIDLEKSVVNGDCYWMICDGEGEENLLWLAAAVGNSTFIEAFYDRRFNNKLYAGRRRFMTQYVEKFPLPNPESNIGKEIVAKAKAIHAKLGVGQETQALEAELDRMVWKAFGLTVEEIRR